MLAEAVKPIGLVMTDDHRYYFNELGPFPSVTTAIGVLDKPAVVQWFGKESARAMFRAFVEGWPDWTNPDEDGWVTWAVQQPKEATDTAAKIGSSVHLLADMLGRPEKPATGFEIADWQIPYARAFQSFLDRLTASGGHILSSEHAVFNLSDGYAGTYDLICWVTNCPLHPAGCRWLDDVKTSKGYYPEYALQLAAYGKGEFVALPNDPTRYPMPPIEHYAVLHLRPDLYPDTGWRLVEYPVTDRDYVAFLAALDLYQWKGEGRFTKSILQKAIDKGELNRVRLDPLTE